MKPIVILSAALIALASAGLAEEPTAIRHKFLVADFWKAKIHYVDENDPSKNWSEPWGGGLRDIQLIGNNQLLVSESTGWKVYDLVTRKKISEVKLDGISGIVTLRRLPDGRTFAGCNCKIDGKNTVAIYELGPTNNLVRRTCFPQFGWLRLMRRTPAGTWLLTESKGAVEVTLDDGIADDKRVLNQFKLPRPRNAYMALRKPDGNVLVAGGYAVGLFEYKPDGTFIREFAAKQPEGMTNHFYAAFQILPNRHVIQSNWNGHGAGDYKPGWKLIEFDQDGKVVWTWHEPPEKVGTIVGLLVLDGIDTTVLNDDISGLLGPVAPAPGANH